MQQNIRVFVGLDTSKMKISVALAEEDRQGEVRFLGAIDNTPDAIRRLANKLTGKYQQLLFCYEAGPNGCALNILTSLNDRRIRVAPARARAGKARRPPFDHVTLTRGAAALAVATSTLAVPFRPKASSSHTTR